MTEEERANSAERQDDVVPLEVDCSAPPGAGEPDPVTEKKQQGEHFEEKIPEETNEKYEEQVRGPEGRKTSEEETDIADGAVRQDDVVRVAEEYNALCGAAAEPYRAVDKKKKQKRGNKNKTRATAEHYDEKIAEETNEKSEEQVQCEDDELRETMKSGHAGTPQWRDACHVRDPVEAGNLLDAFSDRLLEATRHQVQCRAWRYKAWCRELEHIEEQVALQGADVEVRETMAVAPDCLYTCVESIDTASDHSETPEEAWRSCSFLGYSDVASLAAVSLAMVEIANMHMLHSAERVDASVELAWQSWLQRAEGSREDEEDEDEHGRLLDSDEMSSR
jgi:hypothetical protein